MGGEETAMKVLWVSQPDQNAAPPAGVASGLIDVMRCPSDALPRLQTESYETVVVHFPAAESTPAEFLDEAQRINSRLPVILCDPAGTVEDAVRLTKLGAFHFLTENPDPAEWMELLESAVATFRSQYSSPAQDGDWRKLMVGESPGIQKVLQTVRLIASRRCTVLVSGETGTGKELVARAIHLASPRCRLPMVALNCTALPEHLLETELFGHVRGAFTGAIQNRVGRFELANRSTLFLDEIGDMPVEIQAKLLRVLQEREFQRVGSSESVRIDTRVVAATNIDLAERIRAGKFREDLYYRLNVVPIAVPALRDRAQDIPLLVQHFIDKICKQEEIPSKQVGRETLDRLMLYTWPGNVRQLENAVEMAIALSGDRKTLNPGDFSLPPPSQLRVTGIATPLISVPEGGLDFEATVERIERALIEQALRRTHGNKKQAADMLRLKRTTLAAKLKSLEATAAAV